MRPDKSVIGEVLKSGLKMPMREKGEEGAHGAVKEIKANRRQKLFKV